MQERIENDRLKLHELENRETMSKRERQIMSDRENEFIAYTRQMELQEKEFDSYQKRVKEEQLKREAEFQKELEERERMFSTRDKQFALRQREFEHRLMSREAEAEKLRKHLQTQIADRESKLNQSLIDLEREKERYNEESRKKIEATSRDYVADTLETLSTKEIQFHNISKLWSAIGAVSLILSISFFAYLTLSTSINLPSPLTWEFLAFSIFKGLIAVGLLAGLAKYSFLFSSSYMQESLKNSDRRHAINFGKFYLESYGAAAEWSQVKEAFEHWNITGSNAFKKIEELIPEVSTLEKAVALVERANKAIPKPKVSIGPE